MFWAALLFQQEKCLSKIILASLIYGPVAEQSSCIRKMDNLLAWEGLFIIYWDKLGDLSESCLPQTILDD